MRLGAADSRKQRCRALVGQAIRKGELPKLAGLACVDCGAPAVCYDHRDYGKPLMVDPVCKGCDAKRGPGKVPDSWGYAEAGISDYAKQRKNWRLRRERIAYLRSEGMTLDEIAAVMTCTRERVRQLLLKAQQDAVA